MRLHSTATATGLFAAVVSLLLVGVPTQAGQNPTATDTTRFQWVSRAEGLRDHLSRGYDIVYGARVREWILLERKQDGQSRSDYLVLPPMTVSRFQDAVNQAISNGYRLNRGSLLYRLDDEGFEGTGIWVGAVLERLRASSAPPVDRNARYEYRLSRWSEKTIARLAAEGFVVLDLAEYLDAEDYPAGVTLLERRVDTGQSVAASAPVAARYRLLKDERALDGHPHALTTHGDEGYRIGFVAANKSAILLEHDAESPRRPDYRTVSSRSHSEHQDAQQTVRGLEQALNGAAASGYRLLPNRIFYGTSGGRWRTAKQYVAILERVPEPTPPVQYVVVPGLTALNQAVAAGTLREFLIVGTLWSGFVLELPRS